MAASPIIGEVSELEFVYIVMYRLRSLSDNDKKDWIKKWAIVRNKLPSGIKIITEAGNAFGTDFTGFTVFEGPISKFEELMDLLEFQSEGYIEKTKTIIGTKGLFDSSSEVQRIVSKRPID
ncbi:MAG: hypothetical protein ACFFF4_04970 [Candidatus Thorarchaeota archaeon]